MRFEGMGRAKRVAGGVSAVLLSLAFGLGSDQARAEIGKREPARAVIDVPKNERSPDSIDAASDSWRTGRPPVWLRSPEAKEPPLMVYRPVHETKEPASMVVMLHGMCGHPENECPWFAGAPTSSRYLVCPRADLACDGGGTIWSGASRTRGDLVSGARTRVERAFEGHVDGTRGATLVGFSLGAFVALDVAQESHGEWKRLMLIGAFVKPNAKKLKAAGVESVLFASGDWDMSREEMKKQARALERQGVRARYVGMGPVGHWFAKDMDSWLGNALDWLEKSPDS